MATLHSDCNTFISLFLDQHEKRYHHEQLGWFSLIFTRGGFRTTAASKMERFVIVVKGWKPLTIIKKRSILDIAAVLDPPLFTCLLNV